MTSAAALHSVVVMTTDTETQPLHVVIAGGGVAALEAMMALRSLAGDRVRITLLAPQRDFHYRPMAVAEPFSIAHARHVALVAIAADFDAHHMRGTLAAVEPGEHRVRMSDGDCIDYDALIIACGTRTRAAFDGVTTIDDRSIGVTMRGLMQDVEQGYSHKIAFVAPAQASWPLPLYELALQCANRAYDMNASVEICVVSPERAPLAPMGTVVSEGLSALLRDANIAFHGDACAEVANGTVKLRPGGVELHDQRIVALPVLEGAHIDGVPADGQGFVTVTAYGEVRGLADVYAAGDITDYPVKHGGLAAQQADVVAGAIARRAGCDVKHVPLRPTLRGALMTGRDTRFIEADFGDGAVVHSTISSDCPWESTAKIDALHLGPYLEHGIRYAVRC
jgi:sulfide:quinone oxidoreductase